MGTTATASAKTFLSAASTAVATAFSTHAFLRVLTHVASAAAATLAGIWAVGFFELGWSPVEVLATVTGAHSVWLLAKNDVLGWWVGVVSVAAFVWVFAQAALYGEVGIQLFYMVTSLQAIWFWLRGGRDSDGTRTERPVSRVPRWAAITTALAVVVGVAVGMPLLSNMGGAAPFWDALTTVGSIAAHIWLVARWVESWWIWITLDVIYVPLYLSRGLALTASLYVVFLVLASIGAVRFYRTWKAEAASQATAPTATDLPVPEEVAS